MLADVIISIFKNLLCFMVVVSMMFACSSKQNGNTVPSLTVFAGSVIQPPLKEIAEKYRQEKGVQIDLLFGSSGFVLSQMRLTGRGDLYIPGSMDFMLKAIRQNLVDSSSISRIAYLVPAINTKQGNPEKIHSLADLSRLGIRVGIARPEHVCLGLYSVELLEANGLLKQVLPNITVTTESCAKTASAIALSALDAVIGWRVFESWEPKRIETVLIKGNEYIPRVGCVPIAVTSMARNPLLAKNFKEFVCGDQAKTVFQKWGYITDKSQVRQLAPNARFEGEYKLPADWRAGKAI